jgi:hypothetical protein
VASRAGYEVRRDAIGGVNGCSLTYIHATSNTPYGDICGDFIGGSDGDFCGDGGHGSDGDDDALSKSVWNKLKYPYQSRLHHSTDKERHNIHPEYSILPNIVESTTYVSLCFSRVFIVYI